MSEQPQQNPIMTELDALCPKFTPILDQRDAASQLMTFLPTWYTPAQVAQPPGDRAWELAGLYFFNSRRFHEALSLFWGLYKHKIEAQNASGRVHKGMPLVWISDCFNELGFPVHAKRYLMLALCEDALREEGCFGTGTARSGYHWHPG